MARLIIEFGVLLHFVVDEKHGSFKGLSKL